MAFPIEKEQKYTYGDYSKWSEDERWELIYGIAYDMFATPSRTHQKISREIFGAFYNYLKDKTCEVFYSPFDVLLPEGNENDEQIQNVVQPDIVVVCDKLKLNERGCKGAPDLIIEVSSPSTAKKDMEDKLLLYEKAGVKEYWIVQSAERTVLVFKREDDGKYGRYKVYSEEDSVKVGIFKDLIIELKPVFGM